MQFGNKIGAQVVATRGCVEREYTAPEYMVGLSGRTIFPNFYLGIGMSGSNQHMIGVCGTYRIVAVNKDPKARIFSLADVGFIVDFWKLYPFLEKKWNCPDEGEL